MKKWSRTIFIFFLLGFFFTLRVAYRQHVNVIKYVNDEGISHLEVIAPTNTKSITFDVFDENKQMTHSISLTNPVLKLEDNAKNNNNIFYITKDTVAFNRFNKLVIYDETEHPRSFEFINLQTQEVNLDRGTSFKESRIEELKIMSYNIHHGKNLLGIYTLDQIANIIKDSEADIIGLQEVDANFARSKFQNQLKYLADKLSMNYVYGDNVNIIGAKYGNGILSKYPIVSYENLKIPSGREQRGLLSAVIDINDQKINFLNTHLGLTASERLVQVQAISKYLSTLSNEVILVGDFNTMYNSREVHEISKKLTDVGYVTNNNYISTFEVPFVSRRIDYIFISSNIEAKDYRIIRERASDHYPIVADIKIKK